MSSLHSNVAPVSELKLKEALVELVGSDGLFVIVVAGPEVSTVQL